MAVLARMPWLLALVACAETHGAADAPWGDALDTGRENDSGAAAGGDADLDAPADASGEMDVPFVTIDAPWWRDDAPWGDVPFIGLDASACAPGELVLENTPIPRELARLDAPPGSDWTELWRDAAGVQRWHRIAADLERIDTLGPLADAPLLVDGVTYEAEPTGAWDPVTHETLVAFFPVTSPVTHVLLAVYAEGGALRGPPVRIAAAWRPYVVAASTGSGYSALVFSVWPLTSGLGAEPPQRVELDARGAVTSNRAVLLGNDLAGLAYEPTDASWRGVGVGVFTTIAEVQVIGPDSEVTRGPRLGSPLGGPLLDAAVYGHGHFWVVTAPNGGPGQTEVVELDAGGARTAGAAAIATVPARPFSTILAAEDPTTVGVAFSTLDGQFFARVRGGTVVQLMRLPDAPPWAPLLLRWLGDRYAIGWGPWLDELVPCPG